MVPMVSMCSPIKNILNESSMMLSVNSLERWRYVLMFIIHPF
nr:MAG TPA: hypothetical protein [Caudoviricetes sp.]